MNKLLEPPAKRGRGRPPVEYRTPDSQWFVDEMRRIGMSQNQIAKRLGKNPSLVSRGVRGEGRNMTIDEAILFSELLKQPLHLVLQKAGYREIKPPTINIVGKITGDATASTVTARRGPFPVAAAFSPDAEAYVAETEGTPLAAYNGAVFVVAEPTGDVSGRLLQAFGRLALIEAEDHKNPLLGVMGKAGARGAMSLALFGINETVALAKPLRALIVHAIIFPNHA